MAPPSSKSAHVFLNSGSTVASRSSFLVEREEKLVASVEVLAEVWSSEQSVSAARHPRSHKGTVQRTLRFFLPFPSPPSSPSSSPSSF